MPVVYCTAMGDVVGGEDNFEPSEVDTAEMKTTEKPLDTHADMALWRWCWHRPVLQPLSGGAVRI